MGLIMSTVVITGANGGIGLAFVEHYLKKDYEVYALCRQADDKLKSSGAYVIEGIELTNDEGFKKANKALEDVAIDILINNAGVLRNEKLGSINYDDIQHQFLVNTIAPLRLTEMLCDRLLTGAKVAMITSRMGSIEDNTSGSYYGYRGSKAALNAVGVSLANDLKDKGVWVGLLHPGFVNTKMVSFQGQIEPEESVSGLSAIIDDNANASNSGRFWHTNGEFLPW